MFRKIYVPVDNSEHSHRAIALAVRLGQISGATIVGSHVYAARLHDYRFKQTEYTLPAAYQEEAELERLREVHDSLIALGPGRKLLPGAGGRAGDGRAVRPGLLAWHRLSGRPLWDDKMGLPLDMQKAVNP
jgi:nucleotide-binding universal stress UspA family protein